MEIKKLQAAAELAMIQKNSIAKQTEKTNRESSKPASYAETDAESEIVRKETVQTLTAQNADSLIKNTKGTTFIVVGNTGCGRCKSFENKALDTIVSNLGGEANFVKMNYSNDKNLYNQLKKEAGKSGSVGFPAIIKVVDGKVVEFMQYSDYSQIYTDAEKMTEFLGKKVESSTENAKKSEEKTKNNKNAGKVTATTTKTVQENLYDQKGTTYVQLTNTGCSLCNKVSPYIKQAAEELGDDANFISVNYSEDSKLFWKLLREAGYDGSSAPLPMMIKYVDGKPVEIMKRGDLNNKGEKLVETLKNKVENAEARRPASTNAAEEDDCPECNVGAEDGNVKADKEQMVLKQKIETLKESLNVTKNIVQTFATDSLQNAIENANSIDELKSAVTEFSTGLDFNTQIALSSAVDNLASDSNLDAAKDKLLGLL